LIKRIAALSVAIAALAAAPAQADITVSNVQAKPADTKAGGSSDFTLSFDLGGSETIRDLDVNLPAGLLGNPNNATRCTQAQFDADSCPPESKVGTQTVSVTVAGIVPSNASGEVFNLVPPPDKNEPAQLGIRLDTPAGTQHLRSDVNVRPSDSGLTSTIRDIPDTLGGLPLHINSISLTLLAKSGSGRNFMTNPTSCDPAVTKLHAVGHGDSAADGEGGFTPTDCGALPFNPTLTAMVGETGQTAARSAPPLTTIIQQKPGEAATKSAKVTLLSPLSPNVGALANVCSVDDFNADRCPDKSLVGHATAVTPLLSSALSGPVRIVDVPGNLPKLVVYLNGLINVRLTGAIQLAAQGTETTFAGIPDVPLSRFRLDFFSGPSGLVGTTADLCKSSPSVLAEFVSHSGKTVTLTSPATVVGCATTGGGDKRPLASVALRRLAAASPLLRLSVKRRSGGSKLRTVAVTLPGGLSFDRGKLRAGVKSRGARARLAGKRLVLTASKGAAQIAATVTRGALRVSPSLRKRVKNHPKLGVVLRVTDVKGKTVTITKRVSVR
jgi:hypothetical protein